MVEWGGHHGGWGGFGPPSYIVKKCPDLRLLKASDAFLVHNSKLSEENKIEIFILTLDDEMIWTC